MKEAAQEAKRNYPGPTFNTTHPELCIGENFVKNIFANKFLEEQEAAKSRGQTVRLGSVGYDDEGRALRAERPLILTGEKVVGVRGKELHPECLLSEMCIGNKTREEFLTLPYQTKRLGVNAYDLKGTLKDQDGLDDEEREYPVFVLFAEFLSMGSKVGQ